MLPGWVERLDDPCLYEIVASAIVARGAARRANAHRRIDCQKEFRSAEKILESIRYGYVEQSERCRSASSALRKFVGAARCAEGRTSSVSRDRTRRRLR